MTYKILRISYEKLGGKVNRWSPLTHTSDYMTTSRPAAATQMAARVSPAMHASNVFLHQMPFLPQHFLFLSFGTDSEYAGLHTLQLGYTYSKVVAPN